MGNALRTDITDMHYAQLFFVVGHTAIKMLSYIEQLDNEMKKQNGGQGPEQQPKGGKKNEEENNKEDDELDQIAGGKEAEIEQYS